MALFCTINDFIVVPATAGFAVSDVIAVGAPVAVAPAFPPAYIPKLILEELVAEVIPDEFPDVTFPLRIQFKILILSALTAAAEVAILIPEFPITAAAAVLLMVRFLFCPPVFGSSPFIVILSAAFNCITPKPAAGLPDTVILLPVGCIRTDV